MVASAIYSSFFAGDTWGSFPNVSFDERMQNALYAGFAACSFAVCLCAVSLIRLKGKFWIVWKYVGIGLLFQNMTNIVSIVVGFLGVNLDDILQLLYISYAIFPILGIISSQKFLKLFSQDRRSRNLREVALTVIASNLLVAIISQFYHPAVDIVTIFMSTTMVSLASIATFHLSRGAKGVTGNLQRTQRRLIVALTVISAASLQEIVFGFISTTSNLYNFWYLTLHMSVFPLMTGFVLLLYAADRASLDIQRAYAETQERTTFSSPYAQAIQAIILKFIQLVGKDVALYHIRDVNVIEVSAAGDLKIPEDISKDFFLSSTRAIVKSYKELLGDAAGDFAQVALLPVVAKNPELKELVESVK